MNKDMKEQDNTFKSLAELYTWLGSGCVVVEKESGINLKIMNNDLWRKKENECWEKLSLSQSFISCENFCKGSNWYDNIIKPILCWVSDYSDNLEAPNERFIDEIVSYNIDEYDYPFVGKRSEWKYARPITLDELTLRCYEYE